MIEITYAIALAVLTLYGLNLLWLAVTYARRDRLKEGPVPHHQAMPAPPPVWPRVTIQIPLYNERYVARRVIDACARIRYPADRLEIQVLDDSTDDTSEIVESRVALWRSQGVNAIHIQRKHRDGFKAGALQNGLRLASGDFIAIFDADFIPSDDFLARTIPFFRDPELGMVQARWVHLNRDASILTRIQAASLDAHFIIEQYVRNITGCFINFNGTAGIWRTVCIESAGGWHGDTLTEDLDLSYRAQLRGWRFEFLPHVEVPAELPADINGLRSQQFRWTKGSTQTARKILADLWRSENGLGIKLEGTFHLTNHIVFPFIVVASLLHGPLVYLKLTGAPAPGDLYFALLGFGLLAFAGVFLTQLFAHRSLYPDWSKRMLGFPWFLLGSMGLAVNNSSAVLEALVKRRSTFERTPKYDLCSHGSRAQRLPDRYAQFKMPPIAWAEILLAAYCSGSALVLIGMQSWGAIPFQVLFAASFSIISYFTLTHCWNGKTHRVLLR